MREKEAIAGYNCYKMFAVEKGEMGKVGNISLI